MNCNKIQFNRIFTENRRANRQRHQAQRERDIEGGGWEKKWVCGNKTTTIYNLLPLTSLWTNSCEHYVRNNVLTCDVHMEFETLKIAKLQSCCHECNGFSGPSLFREITSFCQNIYIHFSCSVLAYIWTTRVYLCTRRRHWQRNDDA